MSEKNRERMRGDCVDQAELRLRALFLPLSEEVDSEPSVSDHSSQRKAATLILDLLRAQLPRTAAHSERVGAMSAAIGKRLGLSPAQQETLQLAGELHDIGKLFVPRQALSKEGELGSEEYAKVREHPRLGLRFLELFPILEAARAGILYHHERFDGAGYPYQLQGREIPLVARIVSVADCYDAMTNDRAYRPAMSESAAVQELTASSGTQLDPEVVEVALALIAERACA